MSLDKVLAREAAERLVATLQRKNPGVAIWGGTCADIDRELLLVIRSTKPIEVPEVFAKFDVHYEVKDGSSKSKEVI